LHSFYLGIKDKANVGAGYGNILAIRYLFRRKTTVIYWLILLFLKMNANKILTCSVMNLNDVIISDPEILSGTPVFRGTRVPVKNLFDYLEAGDSVDKFLQDFDYISKNSVLAILKFTEQIFAQPSLYENIA